MRLHTTIAMEVSSPSPLPTRKAHHRSHYKRFHTTTSCTSHRVLRFRPTFCVTWIKQVHWFTLRFATTHSTCCATGAVFGAVCGGMCGAVSWCVPLVLCPGVPLVLCLVLCHRCCVWWCCCATGIATSAVLGGGVDATLVVLLALCPWCCWWYWYCWCYVSGVAEVLCNSEAST